MIRVRVAILFAAMVALLARCVPSGIIERQEGLETRVAALETYVAMPPTATPTLGPSATSTATETPTLATATLTRTPTAMPAPTRTLTPTPTLTAAPTATATATPTATWSGAETLTVRGPATFQPASTIVLEIVWQGGAGQLRLETPQRVGYYDTPGDCGGTCWTVGGPTERFVQLWMFSTWRSGEAATFTVSVWRGDNLVAKQQILVSCGNVQGTPTPGPTATRTRTATPTATRAAIQTWPVRTWQFQDNPSDSELLWLYVCNFPVGAPGGEVWSYSTTFMPLDWERAVGHTWLILETGGGDVWLWVDTFAPLDVCEIKWTGRAWQ